MKLLHIGSEKNMEQYTERSAFTEGVQKISMPAGLPVSNYMDAMGDAEVMIADATAEIPGELIERMEQLKLIHSEGVAYNKIDVSSADKKGIFVCNCAGMNAGAVAEQTVFLMQGVLKDVINNDRAVRNGHQIEVKERYMAESNLKELADCKVGLIGMGNIGKCTAQLLEAYHAQTFYWQRNRLKPELEEMYHVVWAGTKEKLLQECDMISLHLPVTAQTEKMCDDEFFNHMKKGSCLINTSRGELVDDRALVNAIRSGKLLMAGLDTLNHEPVRKEHFLLNQPEEIASHLLFSPHIGGITASSFRRGYKIIWENVQRVYEGKKPQNVVNLPIKKLP